MPTTKYPDIFGLRGSMKTELSKIEEINDLKITGYPSMKYKINEDKAKIEEIMPIKRIIRKVPFI
tara:strand:+ start:6530 stop:6724 length:195 start_codon:yes stop_codon:yes gene_type:complete